jgi:virginiamycin B lyase
MLTEYTIPTPGGQPTSITAGPDGALWFTESGSNKIGRITTAGVIRSSVLCRPEFGYVQHPLHMREIYDFPAANIARLDPEDVKVVVLYSLAWDPLGLMQNPLSTALLQCYYEYELPVGAAPMRVLLNAQPVARWTRHGQ